MHCPVCNKEFENNYMSVSQHVIKSNDCEHNDFFNEQSKIVIGMYLRGISQREIINKDEIIFGRKTIMNIIKNNKSLVEQCENELKDEIISLFINGNSSNDIKKIYKKISKHKILDYLHEELTNEEIKIISNKIKNKKLSESESIVESAIKNWSNNSRGIRSKVFHNNQYITLRSNWELKLFKILLNMNVDFNYEDLRIKYFNSLKSKYCTYIPDFYLPIHNLVLEVKPKMFINDISLDKRDAVINMGYSFHFITEDELNEDYMKNIIHGDCSSIG